MPSRQAHLPLRLLRPYCLRWYGGTRHHPVELSRHWERTALELHRLELMNTTGPNVVFQRSQPAVELPPLVEEAYPIRFIAEMKAARGGAEVAPPTS